MRDAAPESPERSGASDGPLSNRVVVVTRPEAQASELVRPLARRGARVVVFPTIEIVPPSDPAPLRRAAADVTGYDWLVFTSVNGVTAFGRALRDQGVRLETGDEAADEAATAESGWPRICAIGPATGEALREIGLQPELIPEEFVAEAVVEALDDRADLEGVRVLLPRAAVARSALPDGLRNRGAVVDVVEAYRTVPTAGDVTTLVQMLRDGEVDLVTFTASSTVRNFHRALEGREVGRVPVAAIGPITAGTARELGYDVVAVADEYTIPGLVDAVEAYFRGRDAA